MKKSEKEFQLKYYHKRAIIAVLTIILLLMVYFFKDATTPLKTITFIGLILFFYIIDHLFDIKFGLKHYIFVVIMGVGAISLSHFYFIHPNYDKLQHFVFQILLSSIIFHCVNKLELKFKWKIFFTFVTVGTIIGAFEIGEYLLDSLFDLKLQGVYLRDLKGLVKFNLLQNPLDDTIVDLSFGLFGSGIYGIYKLITHKLRSRALRIADHKAH